MELKELLEKIRCKIKLGLRLTEYERAIWILYGDSDITIKRG